MPERKRIEIWKDGKITASKEIFCIKKNFPQNTGWKRVIFKVKKLKKKKKVEKDFFKGIPVLNKRRYFWERMIQSQVEAYRIIK